MEILMKILNPIMQVFKKLTLLGLKKLLLPVGLILGLALIFLGAFNYKGIPLAVCLSVGGLLVLVSWVRIALDAWGRQTKKLIDAEKISEENERLKTRQAALEKEIHSVKDGRIKVLNIRPILELGLLEANCQIHKCFDEYYTQNNEPIIAINDESTGLVNETATGKLETVKNRFMGTLRVDFIARYGVDMRKTRVKIDEDLRVVEVQGVEPRYLGCKGFPKTQWMYSISLRKNWLGDWLSDGEAKAIEGMSKDRCRALTEKSLQSGPEELEWLKEPLHNTIRNFLLATVVPSGYTLKLVDRLDGECKLLLDQLADKGQVKAALPDGINRKTEEGKDKH
jgi:cell division protein FtsB